MEWSKSVRLLNKSTDKKNGLKFIKEENKAKCKKSLGLRDIYKYCNRLGWSKSAHQNNSEGAPWSNKYSSKDDKYLFSWDSSVDKVFPLFSLHVWRMSYSHMLYRWNFNFSTRKEKGFICVTRRCQGKTICLVMLFSMREIVISCHWKRKQWPKVWLRSRPVARNRTSDLENVQT